MKVLYHKGPMTTIYYTRKQQQEEPRKPLIRILGETGEDAAFVKLELKTRRKECSSTGESQSPVVNKARYKGVSVLLKKTEAEEEDR